MEIFYDFNVIIKALEKMSYLNITSFCLLSGCGIKEKTQDSEFYEICKDIMQNAKMPEYTNVFFTTALYKNSMPDYLNKIENYYDYQSYLWKDKKVKKTITPMTQSLSISCMNLTARKIMNNTIEIENKKFMVLCLIYAGVKQLDFMYRHLMRDNLLYKCKLKEHIGLVIDEDSLHILPQYSGCEAAILTFDLLQKTGYDKYFNLDYKNFFYALLTDLCHIAVKDAMYLSSRQLSQICDSLISIHDNTDASSELIYNTINILGNELCERIAKSGELLRKPLDNKISSFFTICNSLSCLSKLYKINPLDIYLSSCKKLYDSLNSFWSDSYGFFIKSHDKKIQYSIKEIAALLSALKHYRMYCNSKSTDKEDSILSSCFNSMIIKSGVFINQYYPILDRENLILPKTKYSSKRKPPVFIKKVQYKKDNKKFEQFDKSFNGEYSLWACKQIL